MPVLSIILPCYNEVANLTPLIERLDSALAGCDWEAIFVDDSSPDGTADALRVIGAVDPRIRCLRRVGRRGLASAVIEGALASSAEFVAVMDADLQHDETRLPDLIAALRAGADLAVGSRHVEGGDASGLGGPWRQRLSSWGIASAQRILGVALTDPMSGLFALRRDLFERLAPRLTARGFKILLDLVLSAPAPLRIIEVPVVFHAREAGASKLDIQVLVQFASMLIDKRTAGLLPLRFVAFALVGAFGVVVDLAVLEAARAAGLGFASAQTVATLAAIIANFMLNNDITYRDRQLRGPALWRGLALFIAVCGIGAFANIGIARTLYAQHSGWTPSSAAGAAIGVVWNYAVSATLVWRTR